MFSGIKEFLIHTKNFVFAFDISIKDIFQNIFLLKYFLIFFLIKIIKKYRKTNLIFFSILEAEHTVL
jgi:hypothetical protein